MNWIKKIFGGGQPELQISVSTKPPAKKDGMPVDDEGIQFQKLERREITIAHDNRRINLPINVIYARFKAGTLPGSSPVIVTKISCGETYYCGETTLETLAQGWESAQLEFSDAQDISRMMEEFAFPQAAVASKAGYVELKTLYTRCNTYFRFILRRDREFKRITKDATRSLVQILDQTKPGWDEHDGEKRFADEVRVHYPALIRTEGEKKAKKERARKQRILEAEKQPLTDTRNLLTRFPHKDLQLEVQNLGSIEIRVIKEKLREGTVTPETKVRYSQTAEWRELLEFLDEWVRNKATVNQIRYLRALQSRHKVKAEIRIDTTKEEMSARIDALAAQE